MDVPRIRRLVVALALGGLASPLHATVEATAPQVAPTPAQRAAFALRSSLEQAVLTERLHPLLRGYATLDEASRQELAQRMVAALEESDIAAETALNIDADQLLALAQNVAPSVEKGLRDRYKKIKKSYNKLTWADTGLRGAGEEALGSLISEMEGLRPLFLLIEPKNNLDKVCGEVSAVRDELRSERISREEYWTAEALRPPFAPGFDKDFTLVPEEAPIRTLLSKISGNTTSARYDGQLNKKIVSAATNSNASAETRAVAIQGLMDTIYTREPRGKAYVQHALSSVEKIADDSLSPRVRGLAVALLLRQSSLRGNEGLHVGRIGALSRLDGHSVSVIPAVDKTPLPNPDKATEAFLTQAKLGSRVHFLGAAAAGARIVTMLQPVVMGKSIGVLPLIGLIATTGLMGYVAVKGLRKHHPAGTLFQLLLMGAMFRHFRVWPHEPAVVLAVLMLGVAAQAAVALWAFEKDRSFLGWTASKGLIAAFSLAALGLFRWLH